MKPKLLLCLALVLSCIYTAFALASFIQLKPAEMSQYPDILIRSKLDTDQRSYFIIVLPRTNYPISNLRGRLDINDADKHLVSCLVDGVTLSDAPENGFGRLKYERYITMTNWFGRSLNGAHLFTFEVATNLLTSSTFSIGDDNDTTASRWFYLCDFADVK